MPREYRTAKAVSRDSMLVGEVECAAYNELAEIELENGKKRLCRVIEVEDGDVLVELFESPCGINLEKNKVRFLEKQLQLSCSEDMLSRVFDGLGRAIDDGPEILPEKKAYVNSSLMNVAKRATPKKIIETGVSSIDVSNTLFLGQRLLIVSSYSLPHSLLVSKIANEAKVLGEEEQPIIVFAAIGALNGEAEFFAEKFKESGAINRTVMFISKASDSEVSQILTPQIAMTAAQYFAFEKNKNVLVILSNMTNYANALKEVENSRNEQLSKNSYNDFLHSSIASIYEKAGLQKDKKGSITLLPIVVSDETETTEALADLTVSICDGQIVLSKELFKKGINFPVDVLKSKSKYQNIALKDEEENREILKISNEFFDLYLKGKEASEKKYLFLEEALSEKEKLYCSFYEKAESEFLSKNDHTHRNIEESLKIVKDLLSTFSSEN